MLNTNIFGVQTSEHTQRCCRFIGTLAVVSGNNTSARDPPIQSTSGHMKATLKAVQGAVQGINKPELPMGTLHHPTYVPGAQ